MFDEPPKQGRPCALYRRAGGVAPFAYSYIDIYFSDSVDHRIFSSSLINDSAEKKRENHIQIDRSID